MLASKGQYIILLNPDTEVWPGWLEGLLAPFQDEPVGAAGPLWDNVCGDQFVGLYIPREKMTTPDAAAELIGALTSQHPNDANRQPPIPYGKLLICFCLALRRNVLNTFGLLEEGCVLGANQISRCLGG